jgi:predicted small metal-binding protein
MTMRVLECNACGELLAGSSDEELLRRLLEHTREMHPGMALDEAHAREQLAREAYTATDS